MTKRSWLPFVAAAWFFPSAVMGQTSGSDLPRAEGTPATPAESEAAVPEPAPSAPVKTPTEDGAPPPQLDSPIAPPAGPPAPEAAPMSEVGADQVRPTLPPEGVAAEARQGEQGPPGTVQERPPPARPALGHETPPQPMADTAGLDSYAGPLGYHQRHLFLWAGLRNDYVRDARFDLFADNDALVTFSLGAGGVVLAAEAFSLAVLGLWEVGGREAEIRGERAELMLQRFELGGEARYHLDYRVYGFSRLSLGPARAKAKRRSELSASDWLAKDWAFSGALTAGGAIRLLGNPSGDERAPRLWFVAEGGYALTSPVELKFEPAPNGSAAPERAQPEDLGELSFSAPLFRLTLAGTY